MANGASIPITNYKYGFAKPERYVFKSKKGLDADVVRQISGFKNEPEWMREQRLRALSIFQSKQMPIWGADLSTITSGRLIDKPNLGGNYQRRSKILMMPLVFRRRNASFWPE